MLRRQSFRKRMAEEFLLEASDGDDRKTLPELGLDSLDYIRLLMLVEAFVPFDEQFMYINPDQTTLGDVLDFIADPSNQRR